MNPRPHDNQRGFSLPEILVVLVILGILAAIAIPSALNQRTKAVEAGMTSDLLAASADIDAVLNGWRGVPPNTVNITTSNHGWTATIQDGADVANGKLSAEGALSGTVFTDGSFCLSSTSTLTSTQLIYRSDTKRVDKGSCPTSGFGGIGTIPGSDAANLPDAAGDVTATSTSDNTVDVSWSPVIGATSYTVSLSGVTSKEVTTTSTQFTDVQPGVVSVVVYAKNANGTGPGTNSSVQVDGTTTYALSSRLNSYTYSVANQAGKDAIAGQPAGSTAWVADTAWVETWTGSKWVVTGGTLPFATLTRTASTTLPNNAETDFTGTSTTHATTENAGSITITVPGRYQVDFSALLSVAPTETSYGLLHVNSTVAIRANGVAASANGQSQISGSRTLVLAAGDVIRLGIKQTSGAAATIVGGTSAPGYLDLIYMGPA